MASCVLTWLQMKKGTGLQALVGRLLTMQLSVKASQPSTPAAASASSRPPSQQSSRAALPTQRSQQSASQHPQQSRENLQSRSHVPKTDVPIHTQPSSQASSQQCPQQQQSEGSKRATNGSGSHQADGVCQTKTGSSVEQAAGRRHGGKAAEGNAAASSTGSNEASAHGQDRARGESDGNATRESAPCTVNPAQADAGSDKPQDAWQQALRMSLSGGAGPSEDAASLDDHQQPVEDTTSIHTDGVSAVEQEDAQDKSQLSLNGSASPADLQQLVTHDHEAAAGADTHAQPNCDTQPETRKTAGSMAPPSASQDADDASAARLDGSSLRFQSGQEPMNPQQQASAVKGLMLLHSR